MMFLEGYIGAPPTSTVISLAIVGRAAAETARAAAATADKAKVESFIVVLL
jgi:hypothetical protein